MKILELDKSKIQQNINEVQLRIKSLTIDGFNVIHATEADMRKKESIIRTLK